MASGDAPLRWPAADLCEQGPLAAQERRPEREGLLERSRRARFRHPARVPVAMVEEPSPGATSRISVVAGGRAPVANGDLMDEHGAPVST